VKENQKRVFVVQRELRNVSGKIPSRTREEIWLTMSMCLLTTQQRSGPSSPISRFLLAKPFSLSFQRLSMIKDIPQYIQQTLENYGGIRFAPKISGQMEHNYEILSSGGWQIVEQYGNKLEIQRNAEPTPDHHILEREAARYISENYSGFGPKQSRNFWQALGLTRYEFVLDSRILKWLRAFGFPFPLSSMALGEEEYYCFISDILCDWCNRAGVLPCILDAAIFSSFDKEEWPEDASVW
jgi:hypothetical protein